MVIRRTSLSCSSRLSQTLMNRRCHCDFLAALVNSTIPRESIMASRITSRRAAKTAAKKPPQEAFLGIDLGTTSSRAMLFVPASRRTYNIVNNSGSTGNGRFNEGEYSSTIYPVDGLDPVYNGNVAIPSRPSLSAKISFPSIVGESLGSNLHQKGYELVLHHLDMLQDDNARERARKGIEALLHVLSCDVDRQCSKIKPKVIIKAIALSIPAHWTLEFEELYREMIGKSFPKYQGDIFFLTEAEALAHFLYRSHREILVPTPGGKDGIIVLIIDFGGHNMNACIIDIAGGSEDDPGFYHLTKAQDAGGGSEQWEHYVAEECIQMMVHQGLIQAHGSATPQQRQLLLDDFNRFKKEYCKQTDADFEFHYLTPEGCTEPLFLGADKVAAAHQKAFESALQKASAMIKEAANLSNKEAHIMVTGGSAKSKLTKEKIEKLCKKHGMSDGLDFLGEQGLIDLNMRIAHGAAYAVAYQLSVQDFIDRGAAFGMQRKVIGPRTRNPKEEPWNDEAALLFSKGRSRQPVPTFRTAGRSEFRIICDPFFKANGEDVLQHYRCYNFIEIGVLPRGNWSFRIRIVESDEDVKLELKGRGEDYLLSNRNLVRKTWLFPLYTNIGANAVHLGNPNETSEAIFAEFWEDLRPKKGHAHTSPTRRGRPMKRPRVSSNKSLVSPEISPVCDTYQETPQQPQAPTLQYPDEAQGAEADPPLDGDAVIKEMVTVRQFYDPGQDFLDELDELDESSFTSINQRKRLQDLGAQGLHRMKMLPNPTATQCEYSMGEFSVI
ncbi:hypothetical protein F5Y12DRAFT_214812 [Xylaria sp. FL1777]|nr:hypothetical protein F5Y12DRAFT_214812 [Xylaria sp. FL1777]